MEERLAKLYDRLKAENLDGFITLNQKNIFYLSGFTGSNALLYLTPHRRIFLTDTRYETQYKSEITGFDVFIQPVGALIDLLFEKTGAEKPTRLGFESALVSHELYAKMRTHFGEERLIPTTNLVEKLRLIKSPQELDLIKQAIHINDIVFKEALPFFRIGVSERALAAQIEYLLKIRGAEKASFETIVASGSRGALPHGRASEKLLEKGDLVVVDMGCYYLNYASDMTRMVVVGEPTDRQREIYNIVLEANRRATAFAAAGKVMKEVDGAARQYIETAGFGPNFGHGLGHGVGVDVHEPPRVNKTNEDKLEAGMVITNEPGVYIPDWGGVRIEDMLFITETGAEVLTHTPKELFQV